MSGGLLHGDVTRSVIGCFYAVYNGLGSGFGESIYRRAMERELQRCSVAVAAEVPLEVHWAGACVGRYRVDLLVENKVIVELKSIGALTAIHTRQLMNYLKASPYEVGLLLNFGPQAELERRVMQNRSKSEFLWYDRID